MSDERVKLTKIERWMLSNQLRILEALYPKEAQGFADQREAIESGYELHYNWISDHIYDGLSTDECREVVDILQLHRVLLSSYEKLDDKAGIKPSDVAFRGFDGNNETKQMLYAKYYCTYDGGRNFEELTEARKGDFNAHMHTLSRYREMLSRWKRIGGERIYELTADQIKAIVA